MITKEFLWKFVSRRDLYARQLDTGAYFVVKKPITDKVIQSHLDGKNTCGTYVIDENGHINWICLDIDCEIDKLPIYKVLAKHIYDMFPEFERCLEFSGRRGYHVWLFLKEPQKPKFYLHLVKSRLLQNHINPKEIEVFPKNGTVKHTTKKLGNLVKLPFGIHQKSGQRSTLIHYDCPE